jgi:ribulose-phosphate 3-epimerase
MPVQIAPSIFAADFGHLNDQIVEVERGGADLLHVDIMDGHFVPNLTMGPVVVEAIRRATRLPLDVHLMVTDPDRFLEPFVAAGAARIAVHVEAVAHLHRTIQAIRKLNVLAGVAINPATPIGALEEIAPDLDHVLVMSVNPGFSGQTFIPRSESKIRQLHELLERTGSRAEIGVDGGIDTTNIGRVAAAGASMVVVGSALFRQTDLTRAMVDLRAALGAAAAH